MNVGAYLGDMGASALLFYFLALASTDLAMDLLRVTSAALPSWARGITALMLRRYAMEFEAWQRWVRRVFDCLLLSVCLALPAYLFIKNPDATRIVWVLAECAFIGWFAYLIRLPREHPI